MRWGFDIIAELSCSWLGDSGSLCACALCSVEGQACKQHATSLIGIT